MKVNIAFTLEEIRALHCTAGSFQDEIHYEISPLLPEGITSKEQFDEALRSALGKLKAAEEIAPLLYEKD